MAIHSVYPDSTSMYLALILCRHKASCTTYKAILFFFLNPFWEQILVVCMCLFYFIKCTCSTEMGGVPSCVYADHVWSLYYHEIAQASNFHGFSHSEGEDTVLFKSR